MSMYFGLMGFIGFLKGKRRRGLLMYSTNRALIESLFLRWSLRLWLSLIVFRRLSLRYYGRQSLRDLILQYVAAIFDDLIDQLEFRLVKILGHQDTILIDGHRIDPEKLILDIGEE